MCLQVSSASSGPRHSDSNFTLENSSLWWGDRGEKDTADTRGSGLVRTQELLHSLQNGASKSLIPSKGSRAPGSARASSEPHLRPVQAMTVCGRGECIGVAHFIQDTGIS